MNLIFSLICNMIYFLSMLLDLDHFFLDKTVFFLLWSIWLSIHSSSHNEHPPKMFTFSLLILYGGAWASYLTLNLSPVQRCRRIDIWPLTHISSLPVSIHICSPCHLKPNNKAGRSGLTHLSISTDILSSPGLWHSTLPLNNEWISAVLSSAQMVLTNIDPE